MSVRLAKRFRRKYWTKQARAEAKKRGMTQEEWLIEIYQKDILQRAHKESLAAVRWRASKVGREALARRRRAQKKTDMVNANIAKPIPADPTSEPSEPGA